MRVEYVEMSGFRGFKSKTRLNLPRGFAVFTGRNGVGKSTVFDAMDFALTGSISKYEFALQKAAALRITSGGLETERQPTTTSRSDL